MNRWRVALLLLLAAGPVLAAPPAQSPARPAAQARGHVRHGGKVIHATVTRLRAAVAATEAAIAASHNDAERGLLQFRLERLRSELLRAAALERRLRRSPHRQHG